MATRDPLRESFLDYLQQNYNGSFTPYAAGSKVYGAGRSAPNVGPVSGNGRQGYAERDRMNKALRNRMLKKLKAGQQGRINSPEVLPYMRPGTMRSGY